MPECKEETVRTFLGWSVPDFDSAHVGIRGPGAVEDVEEDILMSWKMDVVAQNWRTLGKMEARISGQMQF